MPEAICDTSPIQYLHQLGLLHLLPEFYSRIVVPPAVVDELDRGRAIGIDLPDVRTLPWMKTQAPKGLEKVPAATDLGAGEKEVLALVRDADSRLRADSGRTTWAVLCLGTEVEFHGYARDPNARES